MSSRPIDDRWKPTLFARLVLWNGGAILLTGLLSLGLMRWTVHRALVAEMDAMLAAEAEQIARRWPREDVASSTAWRRQLEEAADGRKELGFFVCLLNPHGHRIWATSQAPPIGTFKVEDFRPTPHTVGSNRVVELPIVVQHENVLVLAGISQDLTVVRQMSTIDRYTILGIGLVSLLSPIFGYILANQATGPLRSMIQQTAKIRLTDTRARLKPQGTNDELDQLTSVINGLLDRIAVYVAKNREMTTYAAHELRTPLAAIRTSIEVALADIPGHAEQEEVLGRVIDECTNLEGLVNQLLLLSEVDAGQIGRVETVLDLEGIVRKAVDMFDAVAESRNVQLGMVRSESILIRGSVNHLRQVLNNLLDNAIKYTAITDDSRSNTKREVSVSLSRDDDSAMALIEIADTGIGIGAENISHIFDRFYRVDAARTRHTETHGTGLGLSICRSIVEAHGGTIEAESVPHSGTTMRIRLPVATESERMVRSGTSDRSMADNVRRP